jgi:predicted O-methyltransferase YrrM
MQTVTEGQDARSLPHERVLETASTPKILSLECEYTPPNSIPTMLFQRELNYLKWLGTQVQGTGRVIDLGCFLGGSTSALLSGLDPSISIISYDSFEAPESNYPLLIKLLDQFGLQAGSRFLDQFLECTLAWKDRIDIRDGWIPDFTERDFARRIYPESEPIELLFCDIAKTWGVHLAVLHTFGPHLVPHSTVVQQDFFDVQTPWIPVHMWQLRDCLAPLDVIHGTSTASFRCIKPVRDSLSALWLDDHDPNELESTWASIIDYWGGIIGSDAAEVFHGHAFQMATMQGRFDDAAYHGRRYEEWSRTKLSLNRYVSPCWIDLLAFAASELPDDAHSPHLLGSLAAESAVRGKPTNHLGSSKYTMYCPIPTRIKVWSGIVDEMTSTDVSNALYGAGMHTRWLIEHFGPLIKDHIDFILDDEPKVSQLGGIPVFRTALLEDERDSSLCIFPSSDIHEERMLDRLNLMTAADPHTDIRRVYTAPHNAEIIEPRSEYELDTNSISQPRIRSDQEDSHTISPYRHAQHRASLGLDADREWVHELTESYHAPDWATGHLVQSDCAFLWDLIEAVRPRKVVEVGTAAGVSTASVLYALEHLCDDDASLFTFDIAHRCYFNETIHLAEAVREAAPHLTHRLRAFAGSDASDASGLFDPGEIDLVLIDGEHAHPAPTVDLICLAYAIRPRAWIVLHDIELPDLNRKSYDNTQHESGAAQLFRAWPFKKLRPESCKREDQNIGAIQFPDNPTDAINFLLRLLANPWESTSSIIARAQAACNILDRTAKKA